MKSGIQTPGSEAQKWPGKLYMNSLTVNIYILMNYYYINFGDLSIYYTISYHNYYYDYIYL